LARVTLVEATSKWHVMRGTGICVKAWTENLALGWVGVKLGLKGFGRLPGFKRCGH
jgi:hypothetical protein